MSNKLSTIKERVLYLAENVEVNKQIFFKNIGITYGNFTGDKKKRPLNSDTIENILLIYPQTNPTWLITGKGEMLINDQKDEVKPKEPVSEQDKGEMWDRLRQSYEDIGMLKAKNHQLTDEIALLKKELYTVRNTLDVTSVKLDSMKMSLAQHEGVKK